MQKIRQSRLTLVRSGKQFWRRIWNEPCAWLFYCFFQPARFKNQFEGKSLGIRMVLMLRLALPMFLISYPFTFAVQFIFASSFPVNRIAGEELNLPGLLVAAAWSAVIGVGWGIVGGIADDIRLGIILGTAISIGGIAVNDGLGVNAGIATAIALGAIGSTILGTNWGMKGGILGGLVGGTAWAGAWFFTGSGNDVVIGGVEVALAFLVGYLFGYYRLLLYPVSGLSGLNAYVSSRKKPGQVIFYLHRCSLYFDERIYLPLPRLKDTLLIAAGQDTRLALQEISFIIAERPQQIGATRAASLDILLHELEMCESIRDIARASQQLSDFLYQEVVLLADTRRITPFVRLNDASKNAARYCGPLGWKARQEALEEMIFNLEKVYPDIAFTDPKLNKRLNGVASTWRATSRYELEKLAQAPEKTGQIDNPYNPGQVLKPRDSLYVGRRDLVQQLAEALSKGGRRPTFLLNGERRMGKSSTLKQLPNLLGAHYLPIVFDLQARGVSASIDGFLISIAGEIQKATNARGIRVKGLEHVYLREALRRNEAEVYRKFDMWLDGLEETLVREDRTLLLLFDEFEKLEEAAHDGYLNLNLLLDWFRSTIQNRPQMALLFSGVQTFGEIGANWASYFVNAQTLKVSFLQPSEARHLITQPIPHFPSQSIFGEGVVERILHVTSCHPFLVQAICSTLIDILNATNSERAELEDVDVAVNQVLENWWDTYFRDLWERSDQNQRTCLLALSDGIEGDRLHIAERSGLDEKTVRYALQTLIKRDLILYEGSKYRIIPPIFCEWVVRNS